MNEQQGQRVCCLPVSIYNQKEGSVPWWLLWFCTFEHEEHK
jgi:hypothetical protein